jgi:hypothetical protein
MTMTSIAKIRLARRRKRHGMRMKCTDELKVLSSCTSRNPSNLVAVHFKVPGFVGEIPKKNQQKVPVRSSKKNSRDLALVTLLGTQGAIVQAALFGVWKGVR